MSEDSDHLSHQDNVDLADTVSPKTQALSLFIRNAIERLQASSSTDGSDEAGLLFLGNWQDAFPRLLVTDPVLEPVDKLTWQVIRIHVTSPGSVTAFPSYEMISTYTNIKSNHTIARALAILRATRWLSLCARVRNSNGRYLGNVYVLHDEPITLGDAMYLDSEYMRFLQSSEQHSHPRVRKITQSVLATIQAMIDTDRDPMGERIHTRSYERRINRAVHVQHKHEPSLMIAERTDRFAISDSLITQLSGGENEQERPAGNNNFQADEKISGPVQNMHTVQKLHTVVCSSSNKYINTTTTSTKNPRAHMREDECEIDHSELHFPPKLTANERKLALMYLQRVEQDRRQDVLDEWHGRLQSGERRSDPIDNPIGYLAGLCRRVGTGEFQITIGLKIQEKRERDVQRANEQQRREEQAQKHLLERQQHDVPHPSKMGKIEKRLQQIREKSRAKQENQGRE